MTYEQAVNFLLKKLPFFSQVGSKALNIGLENIRKICYISNNPQNELTCLHIAGTNGKGSVAHALAAILQHSGYKVGLYTSPHYADFRERIKVNGSYITKDYVTRFVQQYEEALVKIAPSFFEVTTAMAFAYFVEQKVDIAIIETGLGGRLDATNIISPILSIITNVSLAHTKFLGTTLPAIAREKAGIIKPKTPVIVGETDKRTLAVFQQIAQNQESELIVADQNIKITWLTSDILQKKVRVFLNKKIYLKMLPFAFLGDYQVKNLVTTIQACEQLQKFGWKIEKRNVEMGWRQMKVLTNFFGRWDIVQQQPLVIIDSGHNIAGIKATMQQLQTFSKKKLHIIWGMLADKELNSILSMLPIHATYYFCEPLSERKLPVAVLYKMAQSIGLKGQSFLNIQDAVLTAKAQAKPNDVIYIGGSSFVVAEIFRKKFF